MGTGPDRRKKGDDRITLLRLRNRLSVRGRWMTNETGFGKFQDAEKPIPCLTGLEVGHAEVDGARLGRER